MEKRRPAVGQSVNRRFNKVPIERDLRVSVLDQRCARYGLNDLSE